MSFNRSIMVATASAAIGVLMYLWWMPVPFIIDFTEGHGVSAVKWPSHVHGDVYAPQGNFNVTLRLVGRATFEVNTNRILFQRRGDDIVSAFIPTRPMTHDEAKLYVNQMCSTWGFSPAGLDAWAAEAARRGNGHRDKFLTVLPAHADSPEIALEIIPHVDGMRNWYVALTATWPVPDRTGVTVDGLR